MATPAAVLPRDAFQDLEREAGSGMFFRWTTGDSRMQLPNPGGALRLAARLVGGPGGVTPATVRSEEIELRFAVAPGPRLYHVLLPEHALGRFSLSIETPRYRLAGRNLGVMVGDVRVTGAGEPPAQLPIALWLGGLGVYFVMRRAGWRPAVAVCGALGLLAALVIWLASGGWVYGLVGSGTMAVDVACAAALALDRLRPPAALDADSPAQLAPYDWWVAALLVALALVARLPWLAAPDPVGDLELAARRMAYLNEDGLAGAYTLDGDYLPLRLYILYGLSWLVRPLGGDFFAPLPPATMLLVKLPQLLADIVAAGGIYLWARRWQSRGWAVTIAGAYTLAPPVWMNSAWWGQVDALLVLPLMGAVALLDRGGGRLSWLLWGLALLIKAQAIVFAPLLFIVTLRRYGCRGLLEGGAIVLAALVLGCAPLALAGQGYGLAEAALGSIGRFPRVTYGAYNLWHLALGGFAAEDSERAFGLLSYRQIGLALAAAAALAVCARLWRRSDAPARVWGAAVLALAFFTLPTQIHERYLFLALPFLALCAAADRRYLTPLLVLSASAALNIVGVLDGFSPALHELVEDSRLPFALAAVNLATLAALMVWPPRAPRGAAVGDRLPAGTT